MEKKEILKSNSEAKKLVNFLFETRVLKYLSKSSLNYLRSPFSENVAEHSFYVTIIGWILAKMEKSNEDKIIKMALIHDLAEARGGERNLINKFYSQTLNEPRIIKEISKDHNLKNFEIEKLFEEFFEEKTKEAKTAKDADILADMLLEKEVFDTGNKKAEKWLVVSLARLKTKSGKNLGKLLIGTDSDEWWLQIAKKYILFTKFM